MGNHGSYGAGYEIFSLKILASNMQELNQVKLQSSLLDQMSIVQHEAKAVIYVGALKAVVRVGECLKLLYLYQLSQ